MSKSSFYQGGTEPTDLGTVTPAPAPNMDPLVPAIPSSFYPGGGIYDALDFSQDTIAEMVAARDATFTARDAAFASEQAAAGSEQEAAASASNAAASEAVASSAASTATQQAGAAAASQQAAASSEAVAVSSSVTSTSARDAALAAQVTTEAARDTAVQAAGAAASSEANTAASSYTASTAANTATDARDGAVSARDTTLAYMARAETAQSATETARDAAAASASSAAGSASTATDAASTASAAVPIVTQQAEAAEAAEANAAGSAQAAATSASQAAAVLAGAVRFDQAQSLTAPQQTQAQTNLGLGSAATKAAGALAGNVLLLDGNGRIPPIDGSQITNLPPPSGGVLYPANNLSDVLSRAAAFANIKQGASTSDTGVVRYASDAEWRNGSNNAVVTTANRANRPQFSTAKSVDQSCAANVFTLVTFDSPAYNIGGYYNAGSHAWTPPAGLISLSAAIQMISGFVDQDMLLGAFYKNGALWRYFTVVAASGTVAGPMGGTTLTDRASGSDSYQVYFYGGLSGADKVVRGNTGTCFFMGHIV